MRPRFLVVLGEVFGHALGQGGDQHPLAFGQPGPDLPQEIVHLVGGGLDRDPGVHETGGAHDLLHDPAFGLLHFVGAGGGGDIDELPHPGLEFLKAQGAVVQGRGQAEAIVHQGLLAGPVAPEHPPELGNGDVGLVDDHQGLPGQVIQEGRGGLPRGPARQVPGIVLDAVAVAQLLHHLQVEAGALLQALGLDQFAVVPGTSPAVGPNSASMAAMAWRRTRSGVT